MPSQEDTIAAIATPIGRAGIGIIRISGPRSSKIAEAVFRPKNPIRRFQSHRLYLGYLWDPSSGTDVDEVLISFMKAPRSYTREDVVEINSHSGYLLLSRILEIVLSQGARLARPGEFTLRAFLNGRIDLTQAEAVIDMINSKSERGLYMASKHTQGAFRQEIELLREDALDIMAHVEVAIDFPEEETDIMSKEEAADRIEEGIIRRVEALLEAHESKRSWIDGIKTVIAGRVNVGKSSLLNRLLNEQRAIVTPIPGTTRDIVESTVTVGGLPLLIMDTAGFGGVKDDIERIGISLTKQKLAQADFLLIVIDRSVPLNQDDMKLISHCLGRKALIVINKIDLPSALDDISPLEGFPSVSMSALTGEGVDDLKKAIVDSLVGEGDTDVTSSRVAPNLRHKEALMKALEFFKGASLGARQNAPLEIMALDLRSGLDSLGEIIGESASDEVLERIFSSFCLGK
jgi:tRNA modification GTPase